MVQSIRILQKVNLNPLGVLGHSKRYTETLDLRRSIPTRTVPTALPGNLHGAKQQAVFLFSSPAPLLTSLPPLIFQWSTTQGTKKLHGSRDTTGDKRDTTQMQDLCLIHTSATGTVLELGCSR